MGRGSDIAFPARRTQPKGLHRLDEGAYTPTETPVEFGRGASPPACPPSLTFSQLARHRLLQHITQKMAERPLKRTRSNPIPTAEPSSPNTSRLQLAAPSSSALAPTSSITALGSRFAGAFASSAPQQRASSPGRQSNAREGEGGRAVSSVRRGKQRAVAEEEEEDSMEEIEDDLQSGDEGAAAAPRSSSLGPQRALDLLRGSQVGGGPLLREEGSTASMSIASSPIKPVKAPGTSQAAPPFASQDQMDLDAAEAMYDPPSPTLRATYVNDKLSAPTTPVKLAGVKAAVSSPSKPSMSSSQAPGGATASPKRTKEQIAQNRLAAQALVRSPRPRR